MISSVKIIFEAFIFKAEIFQFNTRKYEKIIYKLKFNILSERQIGVMLQTFLKTNFYRIYLRSLSLCCSITCFPRVGDASRLFCSKLLCIARRINLRFTLESYIEIFQEVHCIRVQYFKQIISFSFLRS